MKLIILLGVIALAVTISAEYYEFDEKHYENFNVNEALNSQRLVKSYTSCFAGEGKCNKDGVNFKKWIPEAIKTNCAKCSPKQKKLIAKVLKVVREKLPKEFDKVYLVHDPKKERTEELDAFIKKYAP